MRRLLVPVPVFLLALTCAWAIDPRPLTVLLGLLVFAVGSTRSLLRRPPWTAADDITTARLGVVVVVTALLLADGRPGFSWPAVLLGYAALSMDAADGLVARRTGSTDAGALYDESVDAVFLLVLAIALVPVWGPWCLIPGLMYYAFRTVAAVRPAWRRRLPPSRLRKVIAAALGILLLAAGSPPALALPWLGVLCVAAAIGPQVYSFGRDIRWLERHAAPEAATPPRPDRRPREHGGAG